jgi:pimeloyl-ACP methyl ester carboxylesterase
VDPDEAPVAAAPAADLAGVPPPDPAAEPDPFVVLVEPSLRIAFYDWGGPAREDPGGPARRDTGGPSPGARRPAAGAVLVHGIAGTAWAWAPVARRTRRLLRTVALDLRGHGGSDGPTGRYEPADLAEDVVAVAEGAGILEAPTDQVVLAGHGFGGIVAAWAAAALGPRCAGLLLVDGGWEDVAEATDLEPAELLRSMEEPPEVLRSMAAFLEDRAGFDPASWDADQERAARASVVELPVGRVELAARPHVLAACVEAMYAYRPLETLAAVEAPVVALVAGPDPDGRRSAALAAADRARRAAGRSSIGSRRFDAVGHNLMRYRPVDVAAAVLELGGALRSAPR